MIYLKNLSPEFVIKTIVSCCDLVQLMTNQAMGKQIVLGRENKPPKRMFIFA